MPGAKSPCTASKSLFKQQSFPSPGTRAAEVQGRWYAGSTEHPLGMNSNPGLSADDSSLCTHSPRHPSGGPGERRPLGMLRLPCPVPGAQPKGAMKANAAREPPRSAPRRPPRARAGQRRHGSAPPQHAQSAACVLPGYF